MIRRLGVTCAVALALAAVDLTVKAVVTTTAWNYHQRSHVWTTLAFALLVVVVAVGLLPSRLVAAAAGVVAGGILGNAVSAATHGGRVANPIVTGTLALNVADIFVALGTPLLVVALARCAIQQREVVDRLIPPRRWERALRRRVGL